MSPALVIAAASLFADLPVVRPPWCGGREWPRVAAAVRAECLDVADITGGAWRVRRAGWSDPEYDCH